MHFQFNVAALQSPSPPAQPAPPGSLGETADLLRQILQVQREQLDLLRASTAAHDAGSRWRAFLARWREDFPELPEACRLALPILERAYGALMNELGEHLRQQGNDALDNDFSLQEFLDRFGMRLAQLGTLLNLVAPLADASAQEEKRPESP
jgi:hypothetical protein